MPAVKGEIPRTDSWAGGAACRNHDPDLWDARGMGGNRPITVRQAQAIGICYDECPVRLECLEWGMVNGNREWMILGGLMPRERAQLARGSRPPRIQRPVPPQCRRCHRDMHPGKQAPEGKVPHQGRGFCRNCYNNLLRRHPDLLEAS